MTATIHPTSGNASPHVPCPACGHPQPAGDMTLGGPFRCPQCRETMRFDVTADGTADVTRLALGPTPRREVTDLVVPDRFEVIEELGQGGSGIVFRARPRGASHEVALKFHAPEDPSAGDQHGTEVKLVSDLHHPNIVEMYLTGRSGKHPYAVYEIVSGANLEEVLRREGALPIPRFFDLAFQILSALAYCHHQGIIHRDLKPANILVAGRSAKIADFGIGKVLPGAGAGAQKAKEPPRLLESRPPDGPARAIVRGTRLVGTPKYMAPELIDRGEVSPGSDVYALGIVFHEMLTGRHPFEASTLTELFRCHLAVPVPSPSRLRPDLPEGLDRLILDCLEKAPERRPADAAALSVRLARVARSLDLPEPVEGVAWVLPRGHHPLSAGGRELVARELAPAVLPFAGAVGILATGKLLSGLTPIDPGWLAVVAGYLLVRSLREMGSRGYLIEPGSTAPGSLFGLGVFVILVLVSIAIAAWNIGSLGPLLMLFVALLGSAMTGVFARAALMVCHQHVQHLAAGKRSWLNLETLPEGATVADLDHGIVAGCTPCTLVLDRSPVGLELRHPTAGSRRLVFHVPEGREATLRINLVGETLLLDAPRESRPARVRRP